MKQKLQKYLDDCIKLRIPGQRIFLVGNLSFKRIA